MTGLIVILRAFWPYILGALLIGGALSYVKILHVEINHYKEAAVTAQAKTAKVQAEFNSYKSNVEEMQAALKSSNAALTLQLKQAEVTRNAAIEARDTNIKKRIDSDEALRKFKLSRNAVQLFNDSTIDPRLPATANTVDAGDSQATLADLLTQAASNDTEHWRCIEQVEDWQKYYKGLRSNIEAAKGTSG